MTLRQLCLTSALLCAGTAQALEVDREVLPRITLGGAVIGTLESVDLDTDPARGGAINSEDSEIALRLDKRLYERGVAGAMISFREDDDAVHFADHYVFYWNEDMSVVLGHAPLRNTLIEFSTLREEDLIYATHALDASSADNFAQTHGDVAGIDWYPGRANHALGIFVSSRADDGSLGISGVDGVGASYVYEPPDTLRYMTRVRRAGIILDRQQLRASGEKYWMNTWIAGAALNLNDDPTSNWSLDAQLIRNQGADVAAGVATHYERVRSASRALVASLHYTARPALLTRWQAMLTLATKTFDDIDDSRQWSFAPGAAWRIGQGVDVLAQYIHTGYGDALGGGVDRTLQIGLSFGLEARFNDTIGERNSILNQQHGYNL